MPEQQQKEPIGRFVVNMLAVFGAISLFALLSLSIYLYLMFAPQTSHAFTPSSSNTVELVAKPWNHGKVHLWHDLTDGPDASYTDIAEGTKCTQLGAAKVAFGTGSDKLYYYKLHCNGKVGYVAVDQVRR